MVVKTSTILVLALLPFLPLAACAGEERARPDQSSGDRDAVQSMAGDTAKRAAVTARAGEAEARAGDDEVVARAGDAEARAVTAQGQKNASPAGRAILRVEGDPGTRFSGSCAVGPEKRELDGRVPASFVYDLDGRKLKCEISKRGPGNLRVVFVAGGSRSAQSIDAPEGSIELDYDGVSISVSQSSFGSESRQTIVSRSNSKEEQAP